MMYVGKDGKIGFSHQDIMTLDVQKQSVAHLEADLIDKVHKGLLPRYLYKYRTIDECLDILNNSHLHFSKVSELRDPFEGRACYHCSDVDKMREFMRKQPRSPLNSMPPFMQDMVKDMILDMPDQNIIDLQKAASEEMLKNCGTLCLTGRPDDICMWAYYADSHSGVCLQLDLLAQPLLFCPLSHVAYDSSYHNIDLSSHPGNSFFGDVMLKKSDMWAYEDEYRTVATHFAGNYPIENKDLIANIIFGYTCSDADQTKIKETATNAGFSNTKYSKVRLNDIQYQLIIEQE